MYGNAYENEFETETHQPINRYGGGLRSLVDRFRLVTLNMSETWLLDAVMALTLVCAGIAVWRNWAQVCTAVISVIAGLVYVILAVLGLMLLLRLLLPRRLSRRLFRH